jgi:zinc protease
VTRPIDRSQPPAAAPPRPYHFPPVTRTTLGNGLRLVVAHRPGAPVVSVRAVIRSGADRDPAGLHGLATFTADMLDEGAGSRNAMEIAEAVAELGAGLGTGADWDASYVALDVLTRNLDAGLPLLADALTRPHFDEEEIERLRGEILTGLLQQRDDPASIAGKNFSRFLYEGTPYGNSANGSESSIKAITRAHMVEFYRARFAPGETSVVVAGAVEPATVRALVERDLGGWSGTADPGDSSVSPRAFDKCRIYVIDRPESVQSEIRIGHVGVPRSCDDFFPLLVMNSILGGVFNSRIMLNLRERHGFTYGARSAFAFRRHAGPFVVSTAVRNEVTTAAVREIIAELERIRSGDVAENELADSRNYLVGTFPATVQNASDLANRLQEMELYGLPEDYFDHYRDHLQAVTLADVTRVARKYIEPTRAAIVIVGKASEIEGPLAALGHPLGLYDLEGMPVAK